MREREGGREVVSVRHLSMSVLVKKKFCMSVLVKSFYECACVRGRVCFCICVLVSVWVEG